MQKQRKPMAASVMTMIMLMIMIMIMLDFPSLLAYTFLSYYVLSVWGPRAGVILLKFGGPQRTPNFM